MKILLTGANGYIGMRLLPKLLDAGHEVICAVRDPKRLSITEDILQKIKVITVDFSDLTEAEKVPNDIDAAVNIVKVSARSMGLEVK